MSQGVFLANMVLLDPKDCQESLDLMVSEDNVPLNNYKKYIYILYKCKVDMLLKNVQYLQIIPFRIQRKSRRSR